MPTDPNIPLAYATPAASRSNAWPLLILMIGGLGLVFLGGCFTLGILIMLDPGATIGTNTNPPPWTLRTYFFHAVLYLLAFACFTGGATLITLSARNVLRYLRS